MRRKGQSGNLGIGVFLKHVGFFRTDLEHAPDEAQKSSASVPLAYCGKSIPTDECKSDALL